MPPGQFEMSRFPRFGLPEYASRTVVSLRDDIRIGISAGHETALATILDALDRVEQVSDFHCVTGWSVSALHWEGYRFAEVVDALRDGHGAGPERARVVEFRCADGYRTVIALEDLMQADVMLADRLNCDAIGLTHGGALRLVAPGLYGYQNAKHIRSIHLRAKAPHRRSLRTRLLRHPRARVAHEERSELLPPVIARWIYRPLIRPVASRFARGERNADIGRPT
nr:molybdopterin-dependent oxidoreductase [Thalassococcus arenae]